MMEIEAQLSIIIANAELLKHELRAERYWTRDHERRLSAIKSAMTEMQGAINRAKRDY